MKIRLGIVQTCPQPHQFTVLIIMRIIMAVKQQHQLHRLHHQDYWVIRHHCKLYMLKSLTIISTFILTKIDDFFQIYIKFLLHTEENEINKIKIQKTFITSNLKVQK